MSRRTIWGLACLAAAVVILVVISVLWGMGVWGPGYWHGDAGCLRDRDEAAWGYSDEVWGSESMEQHFLAQMIPHHEGAVAMAQLALTRAQHPELKRLAQTIIQDQTREIEQMRSWYRAWYGGEVPVGDAGSWDSGTGGGMMGGGMMGGGMMGGGMMSGYTDLRALEAATSFDKEFIEQMVPHHQMAVMMAHMALARADRSEVQQLARSIVTTQTQEIRQMREWYRAWYQ